MSRISLLCVALSAILYALPAAAAQSSAERDAWMKRVVREENEVPIEIIQQLASPADARALKDLKKAVKLFDKPRPLSIAYGQFRVFRKDEELLQSTIKFLADEVEDRKVQQAQYALNALNGLMPDSHMVLMEIAQNHANDDLRARALRPLLGYFQNNQTKESLELVLDGFRLRHSGKGSDFVKAVSAYSLNDYRRLLEKRLRDRN
ncbi:MAG: hypothetical protein MK209_08805, partial [Planctomycetes bacterium]|nr:hypothetical protein [Planctomycetota bacterium]